MHEHDWMRQLVAGILEHNVHRVVCNAASPYPKAPSLHMQNNFTPQGPWVLMSLNNTQGTRDQWQAP